MTGPKILVVEDEGIVALDIRQILTEAGFEVVACVASGEEAVIRAGELRPDLVLMDIRLQGEMNGVEAARRIRESHEIPTLFLTSYVDREMVGQAKTLNALGYVLKPYEEQELCITVEMALHRWQMEKGLREELRSAADLGGEATGEAATELRVNALGRLEISFADRSVLGNQDLSRSLRNLLALLLCSPQFAVGQEEVLPLFWPESPPVKARSNFDSLLLRLRRLIEGRLGGLSPQPFLTLRHGILRFENTWSDAAAFKIGVHEGLMHLRRGEKEKAEAALETALHLWQGSFAPGAGIEPVLHYRDELDRLFVESSLSLGQILLHRGKGESAVPVLERAWQYDRTNDPLARTLYQAALALGQTAKAGQILRQYADALSDSDFSAQEIAEAVAAFK